ncbi:conjugal transfer protein TraH [Galenea microaerophila]
MRIANKFILLVVLSWTTVTVNAASSDSSVDDAFDSLIGSTSVSISDGGRFETGVRTNFYGGSLRIRVPKGNVNLFSISPPSFTAGCSGVDMTFGGFSYINGEQIGQFINQILSNSSGLVIQQGIRLFCPICADVLATMQDLSQMATSMSLDSCQAATKLVSGMFGKLHPDGNMTQRAAKSMCSTEYSGSGASDGFLSAFTKGCSSVKDSFTKISQWINGQGDQNTAAAKYADFVGNKTWMTLTDMGFSSTYIKELFMTIGGYSSNSINPSSQKVETLDVQPPQLNRGDALVDLLLFGYNPSNYKNPENTKLEELYKDAAKNIEGQQYILCYDSATGQRTIPNTPKSKNGVFKMCDAPKTILVTAMKVFPAYNTPLITEYGLLNRVNELLLGAVDRISKGKRLTAKQIELIQISPLPVYKMVSIAAVYPSVAKQLVNEYSRVIAILIAEGIVNSWFSTVTDIDENGKSHAELSQAKAEINKVFESIAKFMEKSQEVIQTSYQVQEEMMAQLNNIHKVIVRDAAYQSSIGTLAFSQMVARRVAQGR